MSDAKAGRAELDRLLAGHSARTRQLAARVAVQVEKNVAAGQHASQAVTDAMDAVGMAKGVRDTVGTAVVQSLCVGAGIWPSVKALPVEDHASLRKTALSGLWDGSGMTLSQTLHGTTKAMHDDVVKAVQGHIDNKATAWDSSRKIYDGYGFGGTIRQPKLSELPKDLQKLVDQASKVLTPEDLATLKQDAKRLSAYADRLATGPLKAAYGQMARRLEKGLTVGLDNLVRTATEEKARYHANRILRTEAARAWGQGFHKECMDDPDVVGWKWSTSSAHKVFDICDFHARADLYRMGPGVYPKDRHPSYPAHPHCFCNASQVYKGEVPDPVEQIDAGGKAALQGMTEDQRKRLLTLQGGKAFGQGGKWQGDLRQWAPPGGLGVSSGAQAVLKEVEGMGVTKWQPDFKFPKGFAEGASKPAAPPIPEVYAPSKTVSEVEASIKALGVQRVDLQKMALHEANEVARALHKLIKVEGMPAVPEIGILPPGDGGGRCRFVSAGGIDDTWIKFGEESFILGEWERLKKASNDRQLGRYDTFIKNGGTANPPPKRAFVSESIYDTAIHEYGHFMHGAAIGNTLEDLQQDVTNLPGFEILTGRKKPNMRGDWRDISPAIIDIRMRELSVYAGENAVETFAEAFNAKYSKGETLPDELERLVNAVVAEAGNRARTLGPFQPWSLRQAP